MDTTTLAIETGRRHLHDLTGEAARFCEGRGDGLLHVFAPHATAGLALMELGSGSEPDLGSCSTGCCRATTATGIVTGRLGTAPTTCSRSSCRRR
jgi:hypothetical protein